MLARRRLPSVVLLTLALGTCAACSSKAKDAERRAVLAPRNVAQNQRAAWEKVRQYDDHGMLVASETKAAGIVLPRGLTQILSTKHEWYFDAALPRIKLQEYFASRLSGFQVQYTRKDTVELFKGTPTDTPDAPWVMVRIYPAANHEERARVYIRQSEPGPSFYPNEEQARARLAEMQKYAQ